jgi:putative hydrolase
MPDTTFNTKTASMFRDCAEILRGQKANPFRVNAYVHAAQTLESLKVDVRDILRKDGIEGLIRLPAIGQGLAAAIDEIARTGRLAQFDRLRGEAQPESLFQMVPGIGPKLAAMIHDALHIDTLEALEIAAHDGRLDAIPGIGARRAVTVGGGSARCR